jgi:signal transduction histidine kinase
MLVFCISAMKSVSHRQVKEENILIVDDDLENLNVLSASLLSEEGYTVQSVTSGSMALTIARLNPPDLILLDIMMPDMDGYEVCKQLKECETTDDIPIIFLSSLHSVSEKTKAFQLGGADYITKPFQVEEVLARVKHQLTIQRLSRQIKAQNQQLQHEIAQRRKAEAEAISASQAKSHFLANMSHELRTPLNAILGFSNLMSHDSLLNPEQQENINIINRSAEHLLELINDVLELSKIEAGIIDLDKQNFDLYRLLDNIEEIFQIKLQQKNISLNFVVAPNVPQYIYTDRKKLRSCLSNLIGNAIKFTPQGSITLRVSFVDEVGDEINITDSSSHLLFQVEDNGCGVSSDELKKLFDAFTQADAGRKSLQGTGLGLTITRKFVRMMGGEVEVTSTLSKGSIFTFYIELDVTKNNPTTIQLGTDDTRINYDSKTQIKTTDNSLLEELMTMRRTWLLNLHQAANNVDEELLQSLIEEVPENKLSLSKSLTELVNNFRLDIIIKFTQEILGEKVGNKE